MNMPTVMIVDSTVRLLTVGQLLLIAMVLMRTAAPLRIRAASAAMLVAIAAYLTNSTPIFATHAAPIWPLIELASQTTPLLVWLFAHQLFERALSRTLLTTATVATLTIWLCVSVLDMPLPVRVAAGVGFHLIALGLLAHSLWITLSGSGDDLVEKRRRFRKGFVLVVAVQAVAVVATELVFRFGFVPPPIMLLQSLLALGVTILFAAIVMTGDAELLTNAEVAAAPMDALSPAERVLKDRLDGSMLQGVYLETGLTIGVLADRLQVPEHRLRTLINRRLGHRNFSAYLNTYRIAEARVRLADSDRVDLPVLTIAMDLGYGSLAPFNRAFREATGLAPGEYRRRAFATDQN